MVGALLEICCATAVVEVVDELLLRLVKRVGGNMWILILILVAVALSGIWQNI